jgi:hypothetical protein
MAVLPGNGRSQAYPKKCGRVGKNKYSLYSPCETKLRTNFPQDQNSAL